MGVMITAKYMSSQDYVKILRVPRLSTVWLRKDPYWNSALSSGDFSTKVTFKNYSEL